MPHQAVSGRQIRQRARERFADSTRRGFLVAFEGPDGSGKTTQRKLFKKWLESEGRSVVTTKWNSSDLIKPIIKTRKAVHAALARDVARGLDLDWVLKLYQPLLWPDLVFYFSVSPDTSGRRVTATRTPGFYEAGADVTDVDDPVESYHRFIKRVIREYESLALIFNFITVDAERSITEQHYQIRELFRQGERRPWSEWNTDAVSEWLSHSQDRG
jgi:dTMP kinase